MSLHSDRTPEEIHQSAIAGFYARMRSNYDFLYEKFGDDGLNLIAEMSRKYGLKVAEKAKKRVDGNDITSVTRQLMRIFENVGGNKETGDAIQMIENRIVIRASQCPLKLTNYKMCLAHTIMEKTVVETLSPKLAYKIGKSIPAGDAYCEHIIEIKES
jgi:hypothetical protein